ncbi:hypothetical protein JIX56_20805 [Streptomyces sp. CA-210063]|uniref:hypothetical protein n=1 Tax=Streptomyces sp. CA-210063 TaxID=2801029 RepID=UPI00214CBDA6|nr:hypothetical protein [Streptomyces sp. CA-210063]UUU32146.1 hypothetical protein JIX56_20805 [Streptomyces sp. CA-210063]
MAVDHGHGQRMESQRDVFGAGRDLHLNVGAMNGGSAQPSPPSPTYDRSRPLFIQYLNPEVLACYGLFCRGVHSERVLRESLRITRLAVLLTDANLVFPASYIFEVPCFAVFLREISPLVASGRVSCVAPVMDLEAYRELKAEEYRHDRVNPYAAKVELGGERIVAWQPRLGSSTADISSLWHSAFEENGDFSGLVESVSARWSGRREDIEDSLYSVPQRLEGQAVVGRFVQKVIPIGLTARESTRVNILLSRAYLLSYLRDLRANMLVDFDHSDLSCGVSAAHEGSAFSLLSARRFDLALRWIGIHTYVHGTASWQQLISLRSIPEFGELTLALYAQDYPVSLRSAVVRIRRTTEIKDAENFAQAQRNVCVVVSQLC